MDTNWQALIRFMLCAAAVFALPARSFAQLEVITSAAFPPRSRSCCRNLRKPPALRLTRFSALRTGTTGIYMTKELFPRFEVALEVSGKITNTGVAAVASGESELAIQPVSDLVHVPQVDFAGTLPADIQ